MKEGEKVNQDEGIVLNAGSDQSDQQHTKSIATIEEAFGESIEYEEIAEIENSPINEPVKEGEVSDGYAQQKEIQSEYKPDQDEMEEDLPEEMLSEVEAMHSPPTDAPEQVIDEEEADEEELESDDNSSATSINQADQHAKIAADSFIGIANNVLEIGGGFFIKIKRKKSHIYFDELLERSKVQEFPKICDKIDVQNEKNFNRIKLDSADIALLRPILIEVLKNQTKQMTPEQQLAAVAISIAIKKGQAIAEIKAENKLFVQQLDDTMDKYCQRFERNLEREEEILNRKKDEGQQAEVESKKAA